MKNALFVFQLVVPVIAIAFFVSCEKPKQEQKPKPNRDITDIAQPVTTPGWIAFKSEAKINPKTLFKDHAAIFHLPPGNEMRAQSEETDDLGLTHYRYQQFFHEIKVENAEFLVRARDNVAVSANGKLAYDFQPQTTAPQLSEEQAWDIVHRHIPAQRYFRDDNLVDDLTSQDPVAAGFRPKGTLLFAENPKSTAGERRLVWMFKVYVVPFDKSRQIYIDAADGSVMKELPLFPPCYWGSGPVTFRGTKSINTQKKGDRYYLVDDCDGTLLTASLLDAVNKRVDISDDDNNWAGNNPSVVTSYWGLRASYDYFNLIHNRRSYDGKNGNMTILNDPNMDNGGHNARGGGGTIRIGLANPGDNDDYNALDIVGHEFTHSVIEQTANLTQDVTKESNALNESFCDIFGQMTEQWIEGGTKKEWVIGDDKGCAPPYICRDMMNPKTFNEPDTYKGNFFQTPCTDPHVNATVQDRWFALLCDGGSGTNTELSSAYNVNGVGMVKGRKIAYRTLTRYLNADAAYADARAASLSAASDLYGADSSEVESVTNAWCAVGLCPYVIPKKADVFDTPGGNPNPASPNNNNTIGGATPIGTGNRLFGTGSYPWSSGKQPSLRIQNLSIYPANDVDYFNITFPDVKGLNGRCFSSGFAFDFGTKVNARIFVNGVVTQTYVDTSFFSIGVSIEPTPIVLEITAPFPGQILTYNLSIAFFLHYKSDCFQPGMPNLWDEIRSCPMCDLQVLKGFDRVILDPLYRQPDKVEVGDHYFYWKGEGALQIPVNVLQGNNLHVELVNEAGQTVAATDRNGPNDLLLNASQTRPGVYSLRFSGFGNGTEILVRTPRMEAAPK
jgi:Zn-dependent metalloprotease